MVGKCMTDCVVTITGISLRLYYALCIVTIGTYINQRMIDSNGKQCMYNPPGLYMVRNINAAALCNNCFDFHSNITQHT